MEDRRGDSRRRKRERMMIPEEVRKEHMAICNKCKERKAVAKMVDFHVDWLDCFWDCPNDYEHWIAKQTEREGKRKGGG